jgi:hypothetical protein
MRAVRGLAAALLVACTGAAQAQLFGSDSEARRRVEEVRTELLLGMQAIEQRLAERMKALEATSIERRAILDLAGQLEALRADLALPDGGRRETAEGSLRRHRHATEEARASGRAAGDRGGEAARGGRAVG